MDCCHDPVSDGGEQVRRYKNVILSLLAIDLYRVDLERI